MRRRANGDHTKGDKIELRDKRDQLRRSSGTEWEAAIEEPTECRLCSARAQAKDNGRQARGDKVRAGGKAERFAPCRGWKDGITFV